MKHFHDLVAGEGDFGYRDGSFATALFNCPQGLAIDSEGSRLFVADELNHRIRVILLNEDNTVETIAGMGEAGFKDGLSAQAQFNHPTALAYLPGDRLVVLDQGNARLRCIDLKSKTVSTLAGNGTPGIKDGPALEASINKVWNILYFPQEDAIYFTQPTDGALRKLDLKTHQVTTPIRYHAVLSQPAALCLYLDRLCVSSWDKMTTYQVTYNPGDGKAEPQLDLVGKSDRLIMALSSSGKNLYAMLQGLGPSWTRLHPATPFSLMSVWGSPIEKQQENRALLYFKDDDAVGFIADPNEERRFYLASRQMHTVISLKDYDFQALRDLHDVNPKGLNDYDYPLKKPARTFRIMLVGDSISYSTSFEDGARWGWGYNRMENMPKRLELMLNTQAALNNCSTNFEVLDMGHGSSEPSFLWPYYEIPDIIRKYDIDLLVYVFTTAPANGYRLYFDRPLTPEGIPAQKDDPEYILKPWKERIPAGVPAEFLKNCFANGWVHPVDDNKLRFDPMNQTLRNPETRKNMLALMGKPVSLLLEKLKPLRTSSGKPLQIESLLILSENYDPGTLELYRDYWSTFARQQGLPFKDLVPLIKTFSPTYYPLVEDGSYRHYTANGTLLYAYLVAWTLEHEHLIPLAPGR
jgi:hypothetical protein